MATKMIQARTMSELEGRIAQEARKGWSFVPGSVQTILRTEGSVTITSGFCAAVEKEKN